jgi:hypothetical protein
MIEWASEGSGCPEGKILGARTRPRGRVIIYDVGFFDQFVCLSRFVLPWKDVIQAHNQLVSCFFLLSRRTTGKDGGSRIPGEAQRYTRVIGVHMWFMRLFGLYALLNQIY